MTSRPSELRLSAFKVFSKKILPPWFRVKCTKSNFRFKTLPRGWKLKIIFSFILSRWVAQECRRNFWKIFSRSSVKLLWTVNFMFVTDQHSQGVKSAESISLKKIVLDVGYTTILKVFQYEVSNIGPRGIKVAAWAISAIRSTHHLLRVPWNPTILSNNFW